ncbi:SDR family oxidoreductase [Mycolicibacterium aubagnense]|uniref:Short-chain dehydrogenase/reductase n=1 Tax=Mycolicibacterium aubagnense TaxID=319707 RepID=A0ABN5YNH6_9MYCO|nr:SDR family oxidoreductase [Mycolicibacterium aubagnense]TLH60195.1 short-chain dehydrogenase/reductase [Mycolicibacterium aubagnense]WGI34734.1 SDR family oxidoreductase [Mycolicibacterium aubagnense]BBX83375.1 short-chain dehydrogenase/reductase [Mycolicibacterium aubagnense]
MAESRTVVITGASRGLGFASAVRLYRDGWRVVAAMRTPDAGMPRLREATGALDDDPRLIGVPLDLQDRASIAAAAELIEDAVGAPHALVHNAGISAAGMVEETPIELWDQMLATHVTGPVLLTKALLPAMRAAGQGRIVVISSQGGVRGMPAIAAYSAAKGALERWAESLAGEVAPFGLGVTVLVTGTFDTDIITDAGTTDLRDFDGPYAPHHRNIDKRGRAAMRLAQSPERFARGLAAALEDGGPFTKHPVGLDARMLLLSNKVLPTAGLHQMVRIAMGLPRQGRLRPGAIHLTAGQRAMVLAARIVPTAVLQRVAAVGMRLSSTRNTSESGDHV